MIGRAPPQILGLAIDEFEIVRAFGFLLPHQPLHALSASFTAASGLSLDGRRRGSLRKACEAVSGLRETRCAGSMKTASIARSPRPLFLRQLDSRSGR